ncbi:MAG: PilC/PilY family type IV pilus protein [Thermodesulfobacteriota bacterium]
MRKATQTFSLALSIPIFLAGAFLLCHLFTTPAYADKQLTITINPAGGGTVSPGTNTSVDNNAVVNISATPSSCYSFDSWGGTDVAKVTDRYSATTQIRMDNAARSITANFKRKSFTIAASAGTGGSISPNGNVTVECGSNKSFTMTADTGYVLAKVTVDGTEISIAGNTYTFNNVSQDHTITATFRSTGGGQGGTSYIPGCAANTYTSYSGGFNAGDFSMINTSVVDGKIQLQTGSQAINPNSIIIPYTQEVTVAFLYEGAGYISDFGWMLYQDAVHADGTFKGWTSISLDKKRPIFIKINSRSNGVFDSDYGNGSFPYSSESGVAAYNDGTSYPFLVDNDGSVTIKDLRKRLGTIAAGTEMVFFLTANKRWSTSDTNGVFFTKTAWNPDNYTSTQCSSASSFSKTFHLGQPIANEGTCSLDSGWLSSSAVSRLYDFYGLTMSGDKVYTFTKNQKYPHVIVGSPQNDPNQWILGWEDLTGGGDTDFNDMVFRIERRTGGSAALQPAQAITPIDPEAYFTGVTFEVYDNMPCNGQSSIKYYVSIDNGANWVEITSWDLVKSFSVSGSTKSVGNDETNWTPGNPALTYRVRRMDFAGSAIVGRQLLWKAEMFSDSESCVPEVVDVVLNGSVATHGFVSRASPSVQANMLYSGSYETPAITWAEKVLRGHLYGTRLYDPDTPNTQDPVQQWDAGAKLTAMNPNSRTIYFPNISYYQVTSETIGTGDGTTTHFSGTLAHHPISASTLSITDTVETFVDKHTDVLEGNFGGTGTINRFTGTYSLDFHSPPSNGVPIIAAYTYYTTSSTLQAFTTANVTNAMLALDNTYIIPTGYQYDFNGDGAFSEADGDYLVNWVRGFKDGSSTKKEWLLGQIDHSVPAVETPPGRPSWYFGSAVTKAERDAFDTFLKQKWNRQTVVYVGSRDGMLHAFDAGQFRWGYLDSNNEFQWMKKPGDDTLYYRGYFDNENYGTGDELWAFIPANLLPRLKNNKISGEDQAYVDASPAISDVEINGTWKTVLLAAEGNGGDTVFCLDVTNPTAPNFLWEFADPDLFRSRSSPAVAAIGRTVVNGQKKWAAFFVSGKTYDNTLYPSIYMIDVGTGAVLKRIFLNTPTDGVGGVPSGQPAVVDSDGNGYIDRIYIGTDKGYLYKVILPDDPKASSSYDITHCVINTDYTDDHGYTIPSTQRNHPIYASPAVVVANGINEKGEIQYNIKILYGTGDSPYYDEDIDTANTTYHFFAYRDSAAKGQCTSSDVTLDWVYALPAGERVFASAFAAAGQVYFGTATSETEDPCEGAGNSSANLGKLYVMNLEPGTGEASPIVSLETGNVLAAPVVDDEHLYLKTVGGGLLTTPGPYNNPITLYGIPASSMKYWREVFDKDETIVN